MEKVYLTTNGNQLHIEMPIAKIDKENRIVSGFATLDNPDTQGDIVTPDASEKAFAGWRKNIREMHGNVAVGKALSFEPKSYFDTETQKEYMGMYVNAYISKGAQDTWEKVLDGTLSGFSIGGSINKSENIIDKSGDNKKLRLITDYNLTELSLVDNPANQLASILSFQKMADGTTEMDGMIAKMAPQNIFYCEKDKIGITSEDDAKTCYLCKEDMSNIGWVEENDPEKQEIIAETIDKFVNLDNTDMLLKELSDKIKKNNDKANETIKSFIKALDEGGALVAEETQTPETVPAEAVATGPTNVPDGEKIEEVTTVSEPTPTEEAEEKEDEVAPVSEVEDDLSKVITDLKESLTSNILKVEENISKVVTDVKEEVKKTVSGVEETVEDIKKKFETLETTVKEHGEKLSGVTKRVEDVEGSAALKKSGDLVGDESDEKVTKSIWGGAFIPSLNLE